MCNLHSLTRWHEAVRQFFQLSANRMASFEPLPGIYPASTVPIVRPAADGERELVLSSWGFVLLLKGQAPKRVTNFRDDKLKSPFWSASFRERRCLVPVTSFAEPKGKLPATWHWFALDKERPHFAFAGIWRRYKGPVKKDGETVELNVHSFMTTKPNKLVATIHPNRMPVMLTSDTDFDCWLNGRERRAQHQKQDFAKRIDNPPRLARIRQGRRMVEKRSGSGGLGHGMAPNQGASHESHSRNQRTTR